MKKHIFLTGPSGCGKTTLIREALGTSLAYAGGIITERRYDENGSVTGFVLCPAAAAADYSAYDEYRFLDCTSVTPTKDNEVFRGVGVQLLNEAEYYPYAMIDEFGGFELLIPQFRNALADLLNLDIPIIGVIKSAENAMSLRHTLGLGDRFTATTELVRNVIASDPDSTILEVKCRGDETVKRILKAWADEYINV